MPTNKPRLSVTLTPESREALERLSKVSGIAASQFITQLIHDAIPVIDAMTRSFEEVKKSPQRAAQMMQEVLVGAQIEAVQQQLGLDSSAKKKRKLRRRPTK